jgi:CHAT domain-containing protein/NTP pyrophosphatase (non-canonical NTP hydrolase)
MPKAPEESHDGDEVLIMCPRASHAQHWISDLSQLATERDRRQLLAKHTRRDPSAAVDRLYEEVVELARVDLRRAERVAQAAELLAKKLGDGYSRAQSLRARAHILYLTGKYQAALRSHQTALGIFERLGREVDAARVMSNHLQPMIYLGKYEKAFSMAARAREIFERHGESLRVARLDSNVGNILHRLDRFTEALEYYRRAYQVFQERNEAADMAVALHNMAICYISLNRFGDALQTYRRARGHWQQEKKPLLVAEADYNIAYLYYMGGEYMHAIELYGLTRALYEKLGDPHHTALCDLDQAEMYLELNLSQEAGELARRAFIGFSRLHMNYEAAKALAFQAMAANQQGRTKQTIEVFDRARELFVKETNWVWSAVIDIYKALVLTETGDHRNARALCKAALAHFRESTLVSRAALCQVLLARLSLKEARAASARRHCETAFRWLKRAQAPAVEFQAYMVMGQVQEALGKKDAAYQAYLKAHQKLESLRSHLLGEEYKIAFLKDKVSLYESLVHLLLVQNGNAEGAQTAFDFIERAKSRSLADLIAFQISALKPRAEHDQKLGSQLLQVQKKITFAYRQTRREEFQPEPLSIERLQHLAEKSLAYETQMRNVISQLGGADGELASLLSAGTIPLDAIRSAIPEGSLILEYYQARGTIFGCILGRDRLELRPLAPAGRVRKIFRLLQFQLSKFRMGSRFVLNFGKILQADTETHLRELYSELIAPLRASLDAKHLIVIPHGFLHYLPFPALSDGERLLMDEFTISSAPSSSVYYLCSERAISAATQSLVLGIPDRLAPHIREEVRAVASTIPNARLFLAEQATRELLWQHGPESRYIHIATHGLFRQDNPLFSSIRLGKSELYLFDLYKLRLSAELVTLSGCGTGLNVVVGGDELLGLSRGLLYAGARAVLVTLWDVNDKSTAEFMKAFYQHLQAAPDKAIALQRAMRDLRETHPHPYYWAPFELIGNFQNRKKTCGIDPLSH